MSKDDAYGMFCGRITQESANALSRGISVLTMAGHTHFHVLFQSDGGTTADGVYLHNYFRSLGERLSLYVAGSVQSAAAIAYAGAHRRLISRFGSIMIHGAKTEVKGLATAKELAGFKNMADLDDARILDLLVKRDIKLSEEEWKLRSLADLWFTAEQAKTCGFAHDIAEFSPPAAAKIYPLEILKG